MKAKFKRIVAALLSAMMVLTMCVATNVHAADAGLTLGVKAPTSDPTALAGRTFNAYRLFDVTVDGTNYSYKDYNGRTAKVGEAVREAANDVSPTIDTNGADLKTPEGIVKFINDNNDKADFVTKLASKLDAKFKGETADYTLNGSNGFTENPVDKGYYVILEKIDGQKAKSLAMLGTVHASKSFTPTVKSDRPTVDKNILVGEERVKFNNYNIGDDVQFELVGKAPRGEVIKLYTDYEYSFNDTLSTNLQLNNDSIKVYVNGSTSALNSSKYTIDYNCAPKTFKLTFNDLNEVEELKDKDVNTIVVKYTAKLTGNATHANAEQNEVYIEFSHNPDDLTSKGTSEKEVVKVYTFALNIKKVKENTNTPLKGAKFKLYTTEADGTAIKVTGTKGNYKHAVAGEGSSVDEMEVDDGGIIKIDGLKEGTYWLEETVAPDGYNQLSKRVKVELTVDENSTIDDYKLKTVEPVTASFREGTIKVENSTGVQLPETGGMGTTLLYVVGIIAMAAGACYFAMDKKRKAQQK